MSSATFLSPSLPVVLTLITVLTVLWVIAFASKVATKRLAKEEGDPSGLEMSLYWLHTLTSELATVFAIPLLPYLFFIGVYWVSMNDSGTVFSRPQGVLCCGGCSNTAAGGSTTPPIVEDAKNRKRRNRKQ